VSPYSAVDASVAGRAVVGQVLARQGDLAATSCGPVIDASRFLIGRVI